MKETTKLKIFAAVIFVIFVGATIIGGIADRDNPNKTDMHRMYMHH